MAANEPVAKAVRLEDWIPLDLKGKPLYHGIDEHERTSKVRPNITLVREKWNNVDRCQGLRDIVQKTINVTTLSRELRSELDAVLNSIRYWADHQRSSDSGGSTDLADASERYSALQLYTTNAGYKKIFGHINQVFRMVDVDEDLIQGAVALVELLTIDIYNLRLDNFGSAKYYNFQGIVHRGMKVSPEVFDAFKALLAKDVKERNFSVPLTFVSTSATEKNMQEFLNKAAAHEIRLHWKIHVRELDPNLLASYRQQYPDSIVSTICAMPVSGVSEFPEEQEVLLRGPSFQLLRMYEETNGHHVVHVLEMVMLNANRDHGTELARNDGRYGDQRRLFGQMCAASKYDICAALAEEYGLPEAKYYAVASEETFQKIGIERSHASLSTAHYDIWSTARPSWIGASLRSAFPKYYTQRRDAFSRALYNGEDWSLPEKIIDDEYEWQKSDWCNVPRLYITQEEAKHASGFTALHQTAFNNANHDFVKRLVDLGAWRTLKAGKREEFRTARDIAAQRGLHNLVPLLEPEIHHHVDATVLETIERHVHSAMRELASDAIDRFAVVLPQLNVLTEMNVAIPSLWVPIPGIYGGFVLTLHPTKSASIHLIYISHAFPKTEKQYWINRDGIMDHQD